MATNHASALEGWTSRWTFVLAATGSAIGLGNIWRFPFIAGENGGGAFVLLYLVCLALIGVPLLVAELMLGRRTRHNPVRAMQYLVKESGSSRQWVWLGRFSVLAGFMILSFYAVVGGMALAYIFHAAFGDFAGAAPADIVRLFTRLQADTDGLVVWHSLFLLLVVVVSMRGLRRGIERSIRVIMPLMLVLILALLAYAWRFGAFETSAHFMLDFAPEQLGWDALLDAMTHAFYTVSVGMGAMMIYGAYMPPHASMRVSVLSIAAIDTLVGIAAGLIIYALVFAQGLDARSGFSLMFHTLPLALGHLPFGQFFGSLFFVLVALAAWSSALALLEPGVAWFQEATGWSRAAATWIVALGAWLLGLGTVFSFNTWQSATLLGQTFFSWINFISSGLLVPVVGLMLGIFCVWVLSAQASAETLRFPKPVWHQVWRRVTGTVAVVSVLVILVMGVHGYAVGMCGGNPGLPWC
ncbi:sodium-dependent transporter [Marinobacteraceae bacterium S3BR75-40.1]